jgi:hypothetical protein
VKFTKKASYKQMILATSKIGSFLEPIRITRSIPKGSPMPALSVKKRSQRGENHAWGGSPAGGQAFLSCRLGLELFARPHNDPVIRIGSYSFS